MTKNIVVYFIIPFAVTLTLIGMYFSGVYNLQQVISPRMPGMNPNMGREFGLLENLQNVLLIAMAAIAFIAFRRKKHPWERRAFFLIGLFAVFIFFEEIDYGLHVYEYVNGITWKESAGTFNLHNQGDTTDIAKTAVDAGMVVWFVLVPFFFLNPEHPWLRYLIPSRYCVLTLVAMVILRTIAHTLKDMGVGTPGTIDKNLSEFRELVTYYLFTVYLIDVALRRDFRPVLARKAVADGSSV